MNCPRCGGTMASALAEECGLCCYKIRKSFLSRDGVLISIIVAAIIMFGVVETVWLYSGPNPPHLGNPLPIGKYYDKKMFEKIDEDAAVGILPTNLT